MKKLCTYCFCFITILSTIPVYAQLKSVPDVKPVSKLNLTTPAKLSLKPVPNNYYTKSFGFFCKQEMKLEKQIKLPVKFRLGSLEYCNYLEQKGGNQIISK